MVVCSHDPRLRGRSFFKDRYELVFRTPGSRRHALASHNTCLWLLDLLSWLVYLSAAGRLFAALPGWRPDVCDRHQLAREHRLDLAALQGRWLFALQGFYLLLLVAAVTSVWPVLVPGAMCGTGVMQAMGISGYQAIVWRVAVVVVLRCGRLWRG